MPRHLRFVCTLCLSLASVFVSATPAVAALEHGEVRFVPTAAWIDTLEGGVWRTPAARETMRAGTHYFLADWQSRSERIDDPASSSQFSHFAMGLNSIDAVTDESQLSMDFDPIYQSVSVHYIHIWRDGQRIDQTRSARFDILDVEDESDELIYNGLKRAHFVLDNVKVGDVLEYAYTVHGGNPLFGGLTEDNYDTNWGTPVDRLHVRVVAPHDTPLVERLQGRATGFDVQESRWGREYRLDEASSPHDAFDDNTPAWFNLGSRVGLSSVGTWGDIVRWALPLYQRDADLPPKLADVADQIRLAHPDDKHAMIGAALQWVQDEIRYLGLEYGTNSHDPSPPSETLLRGFGDCKDKTVLLNTLLGALGIEAHPALVHSQNGHTLPNSPERLHAFDHVITHVSLGGKDHWLDATRTGQRGALGQFTEANFGHALIIAEDQRDIVPMHAEHYVEGNVEVTTVLDLSTGENATLQITTVRNREAAESTRAFVANRGADYVGEHFLDYLTYYYPTLRLADTTVFEELPSGALKSTERYALDNPIRDLVGGDDFSLHAVDVRGAMVWPEDNRRTQPLQIGPQNRVRESLTVVFPHAITVSDFANRIADGAFTFEESVKAPSPDRLVATLVYNPEAAFIEAADIDAYERALDSANSATALQLSRYFEPVVSEQLRFLSEWSEVLLLSVLIGSAALWCLGVVICIVRAPHEERPDDGVFHPMSVSKFVALNVLTLGLYSVVYFYRCFRYCREQLDVKLIPIVWAVFHTLTFYTLYVRVSALRRGGSAGVIRRVVALCLVLLMIGLAVLGSMLESIGLSLLAVFPLVLVVREVNLSNPEASEAMRFNSRFQLRHMLMVPLAAVLLAGSLRESLDLPTGGHVRSGDEIWSFEERYFDSLHVMDDDEKLAYFYSNATLDYRLDGNGVTDRGLFSYWLDDDGRFNRSRVRWTDITEVSVERNGLGGDVTLLHVTERDDEETTLYLSSGLECSGDVLGFVRGKLPSNHRWQCS